MSRIYGTGGLSSPFDIRTFAYEPTKANIKGGLRYNPEDIEDQWSVGICTAISTTQNARKATGKKYSADFQYLLQKKFIDKNWNEGSSLSSALKVAKNYGFLPEELWTFTTEKDRKLSYEKYIAKLKKVTDSDIDALLKKTVKVLKAYAKVPTDRDSMANAIDESSAGILTRYSLGNEWYRKPIEPLRPPKEVISGHAVTDSNYNGESFRIANTWGTDYADKGTAYRIHSQYKPTEAWLPYYEVPNHVEEQLKKRVALLGKLADLLQQLLELTKRK